MDDLQYPVGKFVVPSAFADADRAAWISEIEGTPARMRDAVAGLDEGQLGTPYRPGGWTVRQVVHHVRDSHPPLHAIVSEGLVAPNGWVYV